MIKRELENSETVFHHENILKFTDINLYLVCKFMFRYYNRGMHFKTSVWWILIYIIIIQDRVSLIM